MFDNFKPSPLVRPLLNIGCLLDVVSGNYIIGKNGESILVGGLAPLTGIGGRGNTFKSTLAHFMMLSVLNRYHCSNALVYDTENSLQISRLYELAQAMDFIGGVDLEAEKRLMVTDSTVYKGEELWSLTKQTLEAKLNDKKTRLTTPFVDRDGTMMQHLLPTIFECDSFSQWSSSSVEKIQEGDVGSSERNIESLRGSMAKNQLLMETPSLSGRTGAYMIFTAHMGDDLALDPYAPPAKKLTFLKNKVKFKNVPEKFTFLMNNCWYCFHAEALVNQTTKAAEYPRDSDDNQKKGDTDLMRVSVMQLRGKSGGTGLILEFVVSQAEGILRGLTEFNYIKIMNRYGLGGNDRNYYLELVPEISLSRTTVRSKIDESPKLQRALEITSEMCQIQYYMTELDDSFICSPKELYDDLKAKGYDWDVLLDTRGYWVFEENKHPKNFLSTMDLLRMRAGLYHPFWMESLPAKLSA